MPPNFENTLISAFYLIVDNHLVNVLQRRNSLCRSIRLRVLDCVSSDAQVVGRSLARANLSSGYPETASPGGSTGMGLPHRL